MACFSRLFYTLEPAESTHPKLMDTFHNMLTQNPWENRSSTFSLLLASLYRIFVAEDYAQQDLRLADFISQVGFPVLLIKPCDTEADLYFQDRVSNLVSHTVAFQKLHQESRSDYDTSLLLPPILCTQWSDIGPSSKGSPTITDETSQTVSGSEGLLGPVLDYCKKELRQSEGT